MSKQPKALAPGAEHTRRAFQKLWIAGTAGGFFTAFVGAVPAIWQQMDLAHWDGPTTRLQFARHAYLLWLAAYFALSQLRKERLDPRVRARDLAFDVLQSTAAFVAAYFLGFARNAVVNPSLDRVVLVASLTVGFICVVSWTFFHDDEKSVHRIGFWTLNRLRILGALWSIGGLGVARFGIADAYSGFPVYALFAGHLFALVQFARVSKLAITTADEPWTLDAVAVRSRIISGEQVDVDVGLTNKRADWQPLPPDAWLARPVLVVTADGKTVGPADLSSTAPKSEGIPDGLHSNATHKFRLSFTTCGQASGPSLDLPTGTCEVIVRFAGLKSAPVAIDVDPVPAVAPGVKPPASAASNVP